MLGDEEILPDIQHNSFILPVEEPYKFVNVNERQAYSKFHYEFSYDENGNCTIQKCASRVLTNPI